MAIHGVFLILVAVFTFTSATSRIMGGYESIQNVHDPKIVDIAKFAVTEYNKEQGTNLKYTDVISGQMQVVEGYNYRLIISADDDTNKLIYSEAIVHEGFKDGKSLTSFHILALIN